MPLLHLQLLDRVQAGSAHGSAFPASLQQPRKLAVLAYLALEDRAVPRAELATVLWGDTTDESARASLRQVLHAIRSNCGFDPFIADRSCVRLKAGAVVCDVVQFYRALEQSAPTGVVAQFNRAFMPGFAIAGASAFDDWCERQRNRFDITVADAAWNAADRCNDVRAELALMEIAAQRRPFDQSILRRRMRCMQQLGEVGAALSLYDSQRVLLREQTGAGPSKETNDLAHELLNAARHVVLVPAEAMQSAEPVVSEPRGLRAHVLSARARLRRHGGRLVGAAVLVASVYVGITVSGWTAAAEPTLPLVVLDTLTVDGADPAHSNKLILDFTAQLDEDPAFRVTKTSTSDADVVVSLALDVRNGVSGTATLSLADESMLTTVPLVYLSQSEPEAMAKVALRLRREIAILLAPDRESANAGRLHQRMDDVFTAFDGGAFGMARTSLLTLEDEIGTVPLRQRQRNLLRSRSLEARAWLSMGETNDRAKAAEYLRKAILAVDGSDDDDAQQRLVALHYNAYLFDEHDDGEHLARVIENARQVPPSRRAPGTWVKLTQSYLDLGEYADAYATGTEARAEMSSMANNDELDLAMFDAAIASGKTVVARNECERIRAREGHQMHAIACAAAAMGWAEADYTAQQLLNEVAVIDEAEETRAHRQLTLSLWIAAAAARRQQFALADSLLGVTAVAPVDASQSFLRAIALTELGRANDARPILTELELTNIGRRVLRAWGWMRDR